MNTTNCKQNSTPLKDFQKDTVEKVCDRLSKEHIFLVADEVGLGKTIIAQNVINNFSKKEEYKGDIGKGVKGKPFYVIYICSNQIIARQNLAKLDLDGTWLESKKDMRLSLQTEHIFKNKKAHKHENDGKTYLTALTPYTSFKLKSSDGLKEERVYISAMLETLREQHPKEFKFLPNLDFMIGSIRDSYEKGRIKRTKEQKWAEYLETKKNEIKSFRQKDLNKLYDLIDKYYKDVKKTDVLFKNLPKSNSEKIRQLRMLFSYISINFLQADLIILDEFQKFKDLLDKSQKDIENPDKGFEDEEALLAHTFFHKKNIDILLLSATPYTMYSTKQELLEGGVSHKKEFDSVIKFIFEDREHPEKCDSYLEFKKTWDSYSEALRNLNPDNIEDLKNKARFVESIMMKRIARTERNIVINNSDLITMTKHEELQTTKGDFLPYYQLSTIVKKLKVPSYVPIDFVKSCPYLMSFMNDYVLKNNILKAASNQKDLFKKQEQESLWVDPEKIKSYKENISLNNIECEHAKFNKLREIVFGNSEIRENIKIEQLLWIPPTFPYYQMSGAYEYCATGQYKENPISKYLIFSAWEMVPRMISTLISYDCERFAHTKETYQEERDYQPKVFTLTKTAKAHTYYLYLFLYPSKILTELYDPLSPDFYNKPIKVIFKSIKDKIENLLNQEIIFNGKRIRLAEYKGEKGKSIYYSIIPMFWDSLKNKKYNKSDSMYSYYQNWKTMINNKLKDTPIATHIDDFIIEDCINKLISREYSLPSDISSILANAVIASPAVCINRQIYNYEYSDKISYLALRFCNLFNASESVAAVKSVYGIADTEEIEDVEQSDLEKNNASKTKKLAGWKYFLQYCADGCFQGMFDEYFDLISSGKNSIREVLDEMIASISSVKTPYDVETQESFNNKMKGNKGERSPLKINSHFAVCFKESSSDTEKMINRKELVRNTFNSPMRPFVLATTSIGQEGLDFHNYCRKIIHWNLPLNAIDIEQREGRINRFKCLAVRQSIVRDDVFNNKYELSKDIKELWKSIYERAIKYKEKNYKKTSDIYPFWCLGSEQRVKIERILLEYPASNDITNYNKLVEVLANYRMTLGQPNQEELIKFLAAKNLSEEDKKKICINLSPFSHSDGKKKNFKSDRENDQQNLKKLNHSIEDKKTKDESKYANEEIMFYCTGDGDHRNYDDYLKYSFISAGQKKVDSNFLYSKELRKLRKGMYFFAYHYRERDKNGIEIGGYVGFGKIIEDPIPIDNYLIQGKKLYELPLKQPGIKQNHENEAGEWIAKVKWIKTVPRENGFFYSGIFSGARHTVCKIDKEKYKETLDYLFEKFQLYNVL